MPIIVNRGLLDMSLDEWLAYRDRIDAEGVAPPAAADAGDAALVEQFEAILARPPSKAAAEAARAYLAHRKPAKGQPALVLPGVISADDWAVAAKAHQRHLKRLKREWDRGE